MTVTLSILPRTMLLASSKTPAGTPMRRKWAGGRTAAVCSQIVTRRSTAAAVNMPVWLALVLSVKNMPGISVVFEQRFSCSRCDFANLTHIGLVCQEHASVSMIHDQTFSCSCWDCACLNFICPLRQERACSYRGACLDFQQQLLRLCQSVTHWYFQPRTSLQSAWTTHLLIFVHKSKAWWNQCRMQHNRLFSFHNYSVITLIKQNRFLICQK